MEFEIENGALIQYNGSGPDIVIPEGVTDIKENAFSHGTYASLTLPTTLKLIEYDAFGKCDFETVLIASLEAWLGITFDGYPVSTDTELLIDGKEIENLVIPKGVAKINDCCFGRCKSLKRVEIQGSSEIGDQAFFYCQQLKEVILSDGVKKIGKYAFYECENLERVVIPDSVKTIGACAFQNCTSIKEITIPSAVKKISATMLPPNLEKIVIRGEISTYDQKAFKDKEFLKTVFIAEDQYESARKWGFKKVKFYNLDGEPITGDKKNTKNDAPGVASSVAANLSENAVSYPDSAQIPAAIEPFVMSKGAPKSFAKPAVTELYYQLGGKTFTITLKIASKLPSIWKRYYLTREDGEAYDPLTVLKKATSSGPYLDDGSGEMIYNPLAEDFPELVAPLSSDQVVERLSAFAVILNRCVLEEPVRKIMEKAEKKKNGGLYKGRVLHLAYLDLVDHEGTTYELVAKNEGDTDMTLELRSKVPVTDELLRQTFLLQ
ncbi:MAG: leucine-rich repeat domain-containing protein [Clostridia bacterium]|nr:leucine-rich repeat domain-containing protein [Clostridia bacterium]